MVLVALDVAAPALQSRRRFEHVPQGLGAGLAVGGEVVDGGDELVAFVADVAGLLSDGQRLHGKLRLLFALAFVGVQNLWDGSRTFKLVYKRSDQTSEQGLELTWNILGISLASARYTSV